MRTHRYVAVSCLALVLSIASCTTGDDESTDEGTSASTSASAATSSAAATASSPAGSATTAPGDASSSATATEAAGPATAGTAFRVTNPIVEQRADPSIYRHTDGYYYMTASVPTYDQIEVRRSKTLQGLGDAKAVVVWEAKESGPQSEWVWAPEIFFIDGAWYIHYSAGEKIDPFPTHRMYVLTTKGDDPTSTPWTEAGEITTKWETFSLDQTTFAVGDQRYLVWAQQDPEIRNNSNLYIAKMDSPTTITGEQVMIGTPTFGWEGEGYVLNEAPQILHRNGRIFLAYSSSATDARYKMGLYTADEKANLLDPKSWTKAEEPVFQTSEDNKVFGPGSNAFTVSEDGKDDLLVYNARNYRDPEPDPLNDPNRSTRIQQLLYDEKGAPFFGVPVAEGPSPGRLRAVGAQKCLQRGEPLALADCADEAPQQLDFDHLGNGAYTIAAEGSCLAVGGDAPTFAGCDSSEGAQWRIRPADNGRFQLVEGGAAKRCLVGAASGPPTLSPCAAGDDQLWIVG